MKQQAAHSHEDTLLDFAYGELPAAEARGVEAHLEGCAKCAAALDSIRGVRRTMSLLDDEPAPDAGLESLMAYAQQTARRIQAGPSSSKSKWRRWVFSLAGAASVAVVGIVGVQVSKELDLQASAEQALVKKAEPEPLPSAAPAPAPAPVVEAPGAATQLSEQKSEGGIAREAARVTPQVPQKGGVVTDEGTARRDDYETVQLGEKAGRIAEAPRKKKAAPPAEYDRKDYLQAPRGGAAAGIGSTAGSVVGGTSASAGKRAADEAAPAAPAPAPERNIANDTEGARPSSLSRREASAQKEERSRLSLDSAPQRSAPAAEAETGEESFDDSRVASAPADSMAPMVAQAQPPPPPQAQATRKPASPSPKTAGASSALEYEELANLARKRGDRTGEIQHLRSAVALTGPGAQQIGLLSRLCEVELAAGLHQPTSCHRLASEYPTHNAGILARRRLQSQQQNAPAADPAVKQ